MSSDKPAFKPPPLKKGKSAPNINRGRNGKGGTQASSNNKIDRPTRYRPPLYRADSGKITKKELGASARRLSAGSLNKGKSDNNNEGPPSPLTRGHSCRITKNELLISRLSGDGSTGPPSPVYENDPPRLNKSKKQRSNRNLAAGEDPPKLGKGKKKGSNRNLVDGEKREKAKPLRDGAGKLLDLKKEAMVVGKSRQRIETAESLERSRKHCFCCFPRMMLLNVDKFMGGDGFDSPSYIPKTNIYLGGQAEARDYSLLRHLGVTHVLNAAVQLPNYHEKHFVYHNIPIVDSDSVSIYTYLAGAAAFLKHVEEVGGRAYVHCIAGICRSTCCVVSYLMLVRNMRLNDAIRHCQSVRWIAQPNPSFMKDLQKYEKNLLSSGAGDTPKTKNRGSRKIIPSSN